MLALYISLGIIGGLIILYLFISFNVYWVIFHSPNKQQKKYGDFPNDPSLSQSYDLYIDLVKKLQSERYENVYITSYDKLKLRGRYYHSNDNAPIALCFHGFRGTPIRDFCGGYQILKERGYNVLLVDERAHISSKGHTITFGVKESRDATSWINYLINRFGKDTKILLVGISMGGYIVANTIINEDIPNNVFGAILDCPYHSPVEILRHSCVNKLHIPWWLGGTLLRSAAFIFGHFSFYKEKYQLTNKLAKVNFIVIHGDNDSIVPCQFSDNLLLANKEAKKYVFKGAEHGVSYLVDKELYKKCVNDFINENLK